MNTINVILDMSEVKTKFDQGHYIHIDDHFSFSDLLMQLLTVDQIQDCSLIDEIACFISDDLQEKTDTDLYDQVYNACTQLCSDIGVFLYSNTGFTEDQIRATTVKSNIVIVEYEKL